MISCTPTKQTLSALFWSACSLQQRERERGRKSVRYIKKERTRENMRLRERQNTNKTKIERLGERESKS